MSLFRASFVAHHDQPARRDGKAEHGPRPAGNGARCTASHVDLPHVIVERTIAREVHTPPIRRPRGTPLGRHIVGLLLTHEQARRAGGHVCDEQSTVFHEHIALVHQQRFSAR
jgi:hypothetical protein